MAWADGVVTQGDGNVTGHTTGGLVWPAARAACAFLERMQHDIGLAGCTVLELGAGCGLLGLSVAANTTAAVCLTEQPGLGLAHLQRNVDLNGRLPNVTVCACDWRDFGEPEPAARGCPQADPAAAGAEAAPGPSQQAAVTQPAQQGAATAASAASHPHCPHPDSARLLAQRWDFIIGSDLVYDLDVGCRMLPRALRALSHPGTHIYYAHTKHRYDHCDLEFFEELQRQGFAVEEVWTPEQGPPPESPPPLTSLFPEQRIAMYHMQLR